MFIITFGGDWGKENNSENKHHVKQILVAKTKQREVVINVLTN